METLRKITKARTSQELQQMIANDTERGWNVASKVNHFPYHSRPYQILMKFSTERD